MSRVTQIDDPDIEGFVNQSIEIHQGVADAVLYHYTSVAALSSILESQSLWMSHVLHMNDPAEFSHGIGLFKEGLAIIEQAGVKKEWLDGIGRFLDREKSGPGGAPFVFSTTQSIENADQWRDYAYGARGVALGFDAQSFKPLAKAMGGPTSIIYDEPKQREIVVSIAEGFVALLRTVATKMNDPDFVGAVGFGYFRAAYIQAMRFKNIRWQGEAEWRYFTLTKDEDPQILERVSGSRNVRYIVVNAPDLASMLRHVVIGASADPSTKFEIEKLRERYGLKFSITHANKPGVAT